jgi:DNA invertase Pin-like site-specific DNA recombinase
MRKPDRPKSSQIFRCAIYTRKSSDDGLEQEFNSLDAQREACEAYVTSQRHAGWIALPEMYDDGGSPVSFDDRTADRESHAHAAGFGGEKGVK